MKPIRSLSPGEYERFVERVLLELDIWKNATVYRNKRFEGIRQAGSYEVDIALHLNLSELVSFLLIVECKNHTRPVTRPVVQQLAQTRDAIGAQKAAVVSPVGFSKEAIEVARSLSVALWVIGEDIPTQTIMAYDGPKIEVLSRLFLQLRASYLRLFGLVPKQAPDDYLQLIDSAATTRLEAPRVSQRVPVAFVRQVQTGSAFFSFQYDRLFDHHCAANRIVGWIVETHLDELLQDAERRKTLTEWRDEMRRYAEANDYDVRLVDAVEADNWAEFFTCFDRISREHWTHRYLRGR